ncbi:MAG: sigma-70 family RNA polymerase sigma factor [Planctomycetota bacterium]|nr:sigma-70 family RNA polymerase sigma factor [Planctomycetota bacterium]
MVKLLENPAPKKTRNVLSSTKLVKKQLVKKQLVKKQPVKKQKVKSSSEGSAPVGQVPKSPAASKSSGLPRTFRSKDLEASFVHYCQLICPQAKSPEEIALSVKSLTSSEIDFMGNPDFSTSDVESSLFADKRLLPICSDDLRRVKTPDLPAHLARLCETKLLTPEEEVETFRRMNFLRFKANELCTELKSVVQTQLAKAPTSKTRLAKSVDQKAQASNGWTVRRIESLLKAADWYRDRLVKSNMRLVISIVKKFVNTHNAFDDLLSDGIVALMRAVDKFDVGLGFRFSTYATQVVRRNSYRRVMENQTERQRITLSVHDSGVDISDEHRAAGMSEVRWEALRARLSTMLGKLDRREKLIVRARFSLGGHRRVQTLQKLADRLGVSKERIRQLEKRALDKLRDMADVTPIRESDL